MIKFNDMFRSSMDWSTDCLDNKELAELLRITKQTLFIRTVLWVLNLVLLLVWVAAILFVIGPEFPELIDKTCLIFGFLVCGCLYGHQVVKTAYWRRRCKLFETAGAVKHHVWTIINKDHQT